MEYPLPLAYLLKPRSAGPNQSSTPRENDHVIAAVGPDVGLGAAFSLQAGSRPRNCGRFVLRPGGQAMASFALQPSYAAANGRAVERSPSRIASARCMENSRARAS